MKIKLRLKDKNYKPFAHETTYKKYAIYVNDFFIGYKNIDNNNIDNIYIEIVCPKQISKKIWYELTKIYPSNNIEFLFDEEINIKTNNLDSLERLDFIKDIIIQNNNLAEKMKKITGCSCIERFSFYGDLNINCEHYTKKIDGAVSFSVDHLHKVVSSAQGYCHDGKDVAKKLHYKWTGFGKEKDYSK